MKVETCTSSLSNEEDTERDRMEKSRMKEDVRSIILLQVEQILGTFSAKGIKDLLIRGTMTMSKTAKDARRNMKLV